jgi:hypothetical protein
LRWGRIAVKVAASTASVSTQRPYPNHPYPCKIILRQDLTACFTNA